MSEDDAWDAEDFDPEAGFSKPEAGENTWEGEDEGLVIEQEPEEEVKQKPEAVKKSKEERIKERKAKRRDEEMKKKHLEETPPPLSAEEQQAEKERLVEAQRESDLQAAMELFGVSSDSSSIDRMNPSKPEEFDEFQQALVKKIIHYEGNSHFYTFLEGLIRSICVPLDSEDLRKLSNMLGVMASEKQKMKQPHAKKKKTKGVLSNVGKASKRLERDNYEDDELGADFDDFL